MSRLLYNNQSGLLGASLTNSGTTITFATAPNFATITGSDYIPLVLQPGTPNFEIVYLTAYTALATTGTITRGAEDATRWPAIAHSNGTAWAMAPTKTDYYTLLGIPAGNATLTTAFPVPNTAFTVINTYMTAGTLKGGMTLASGQFVVPVAGMYAITGSAWWTQNTLAIYQASGTHNSAQVGSSSGEIYINPATGSYGLTTSFTDLVLCAAGDTIGMGVFQGAGGIINLQTGYTKMACWLVSQ
jgi:hypothetical protein